MNKKLSEHQRLLLEWNEKVNLVSRKSIATVYPAHYCDCIEMVNRVQPFIEARKLIDLGSGAGFPGMIQAILFPQLKIELYESIGKKRAFLQEVKDQLKLSNVEIKERLEKPCRQPIFLFARAVMKLDELLDFFKMISVPKSRIVVNQGEQNYRQIEKKFLKPIFSDQYTLPDDFGVRKVDVFENCST